MLTITQSQSIDQLFAHLVHDMRGRQLAGQLGVFDSYNLIVPSASVKTWINQSLADTQGIAAMMNARFWGNYQWQLISEVIDGVLLSSKQIDSLPKLLKQAYEKNRRLVPREANLSIGFMQWRIFAFLQSELTGFQDLSAKKQDAHPLAELLDVELLESEKLEAGRLTTKQSQNSRFWQLAKQIAQVFSAYLTHRPNWMAGLSAKKSVPIPVDELIGKKDALNKVSLTPDWLATRYKKVADWQAYIWRALFVEDYNYREQLYDWFWQRLHEPAFKSRLPKQITFFTLPPVPKAELELIRKLATYTDVVFLHYNPSQEYWADITDPYWLAKHSIGEQKLAALRETGHFLLARMGKQARDTFKLLIELSGGADDLFERVEWQDDFVEATPNNLLQQIQQDILLLQEEGAIDWLVADNQADNHADDSLKDDSIKINACHSLIRQLEVLREDIVVWLNQSADRHPSDVLVMLPDLASAEAHIRTVFPSFEAADGYQLPARLTGLSSPQTLEAWQALKLRYTLLETSLASETLYDWLLLAPIYESLNLSYEDMQRGIELLTEAGFKRGFDAEHIEQFLADDASTVANAAFEPNAEFDGDARFSLRYALDRLVLGLVMPSAEYFDSSSFDTSSFDAGGFDKSSFDKSSFDKSGFDASGEAKSNDNTDGANQHLPYASVALSDAPIISALVQTYHDLSACRALTKSTKPIATWVDEVLMADMETHFNHLRGTESWQEITNAMSQLKSASMVLGGQNSVELEQSNDNQQLAEQPLPFVLDALTENLAGQMRGSESTGAITFARIGTVRPIPFKLIVLLNMNIGDFPNREQPNFFNLMHAGLPEVGDRQREEDDTGAFLDALMMAKEAAWFYYDGFSTSDTHQHLPANPLYELMLFLEDIYKDKKYIESGSQEKLDQGVGADAGTGKAETMPAGKTTASDKNSAPNIPQWIAHPPLPFSAESFKVDAAAQRRQGFWYDIYQRLHGDKKASFDFITFADKLVFPSKYTPAETVFVEGLRLVNDLAKPATHFLRSQQIRTIEGDDDHATREPLILDKLDEYGMRDAFIDSAVSGAQVNAVTYSPLLPAGVAKQAYFSKAQTALQAQLDELKRLTHESITQTTPQTVALNNHQITIALPEEDKKLWANALPTNGENHHKLKMWLIHLLWQMHRKTSAAQVAEIDGKSVWIFSKNNAVSFKPVAFEEAQSYMSDWLRVWHYGKDTPFVLPTVWGIKAAKSVSDDKPIEDIKLGDWLTKPYSLDYIPDSCSLHPTWQLILAGHDARNMLIEHMDVFAQRLYQPMQEAELK